MAMRERAVDTATVRVRLLTMTLCKALYRYCFLPTRLMTQTSKIYFFPFLYCVCLCHATPGLSAIASVVREQQLPVISILSAIKT